MWDYASWYWESFKNNDFSMFWMIFQRNRLNVLSIPHQTMKSVISLKKLTYFVNISWLIVSLLFWKDLLWFQDCIWEDKFKDYNWHQDNHLEWADFSNIETSHMSENIFRILVQESISYNHSIFIKFDLKFDSKFEETIQLRIQFEGKTIPKSKHQVCNHM
jgi:hypothetical protein